MKNNNVLRYLFNTATSVSLDDEFIRYLSPDTDDEHEIVISLDDDRYEFSTESIDSATFNDSVWSVYCDYNEQHIDVKFFEVTDITAPPADSEVITIKKECDILASAKSETIYRVNRQDWMDALESAEMEAEEALFSLQYAGKVERIDSECEPTEVMEDYNVKVFEL